MRTCTVILPEGNQAEGSQAERSQAALSQATVNQGGGSQNDVSQGGGSQAIVKGGSCFEQLQGSTIGSPSTTSNIFVIRTRRDKLPFRRSKSTSTHT
ncbi:unnamed protein product [Ilex paraguariensis]|uniref:Uncharacterized protein n=1 Tax=Ilex paraguariensis TaxID=185542 RepID=A0ABC8V0D1_9AQUA